MKFRILFFLSNLFCTTFLYAQSIIGNFAPLANQQIMLEGFHGLKNYPIAKTKIDDKGNFKLIYSTADYGMGYLVSADQKIFLIMLAGEDIALVGEALSNPQTIKITKGEENQWFEQYANEYPKREQALIAWGYLEKIYTQEALFAGQKVPKKAIQQERKRINDEDAAFLNSLPKESYCSWFLPMRKLVSSVSVVAQQRTEEIPATIQAFRSLDYTDKRLYKSGLFKDAIEAHFWLLENSGKSLDSVFVDMQFSIDAMMTNLKKDEQKLNEVSNNLFNLLEKHSLFKASEYLSLKVLNEVSCTINSDLARELETYRAMKVGNTTPDIVFPSNRVNPTNNLTINKLSDLSSNYTLIVFGASWCPNCKEEIPAIAKLYSTWKEKGVEVLLVSLDEDPKAFYEFTSNFPFISITDLKKWDGPITKDYYVFGTPTMYLLDKNRKIILRPNTIAQMDTWVDWNLVQGNK
jgi:thiol-disulfide isomerase/thioredoxin